MPMAAPGVALANSSTASTGSPTRRPPRRARPRDAPRAASRRLPPASSAGRESFRQCRSSVPAASPRTRVGHPGAGRSRRRGSRPVPSTDRSRGPVSSADPDEHRSEQRDREDRGREDAQGHRGRHGGAHRCGYLHENAGADGRGQAEPARSQPTDRVGPAAAARASIGRTLPARRPPRRMLPARPRGRRPRPPRPARCRAQRGTSRAAGRGPACRRRDTTRGRDPARHPRLPQEW